MLKKWYALLVVTLLAPALAAPPAWGQEAEDERWETRLGLTFNGSGGNERLTLLTTDLGVTHLQTDVFELALNGRVRYGESEGETIAQNYRGALTFDLYPEARWSPFVFTTAERDLFRRLQLRLNGGAGAKYTHWKQDWSEVSVSGAVLFSYEDLELEPGQGDEIRRTARQSWRVRARRQLGEGKRLEQLVFYQPVFEDLGDYNLEASGSAQLALTSRIGLTTSLIYERDSTPPPDVQKDDWAVAVGLNLTTKW